ncbi:MAG: putative Ig domain-containing protein, partial [Halothiobacillaceae bacterium]|nr:putative Ig domain-containing protein [Halothiobacillaceae bacterium]
FLGSDNDVGLGNLGNDILLGKGGNDYLLGGPSVGDADKASQDIDTLIGGDDIDILNGGIGDDTLLAMDSDFGMQYNEGAAQGDWLMGGKGEDLLYGSSKADVLTGGSGNDEIQAGGGDDLILGDAHLEPYRRYNTISEPNITREYTWDQAQGAYIGKIVGGFAVYPNTVFQWKIQFDENDYRVTPTLGLSTDTRVMDGGGSDLLHGGAGNDWIAGQTGDDTLYGDEGNDILYGDDSVPLPSGSAAGNDILYAGSGADILHGGDGHDQLHAEEADGDQDRLYGEAGDDLLYGGSGRDLLDGGAGNDGLFAGSDGSTLIGGSGNDFFRGGAGDDTQQDASGNDTYHFSGGTDTITDTEGNDQYLLFSNALSAGGVTTVQDADGVGRVYLDGVLIDGKGLLKRSDQHWESTDGRYSLNRDGGQLTIRVTGQAGQVIFQNYSDGALGITLPSTPVNPPPDPDPKPGNEAPKAGVPLEARQTIEQDQRFSYDLPTGAFTDPDGDALRLGAKRVDGSALPSWLIFDAATGQFSGTPENADVGTLSIRVTATDPDGESTFQDFTLDIINRNDAPEVGIALTPQQAKEGQPWSYTPEADSFIDPDPGDTLHYSATLADGSPLPSWLAFDPVTGGFSGTPPTGTAGDVLLRLIATDDSGASVSQDFSLSVSPAQGQPDPNPIRGTPGNDSLYGTPGSDTLDGQGGDDWLNGGQGDDIYVFGRGYGRDTVWDYDGTAGNRDVVRLEPGIVSSDVRVTRDGANLILNLDSGEQLVLSNWYIDPANRIEELHFADGTVWDAAQLGAAAVFEGTQGNDALGVGYTTEGVHFQGLAGDDQLSSSVGDDWLDGGEGNDTLYASDGADILDGGQGNDTLNGGSGNDTYLFGQGYGQDTIWDYDQSAGNHDRIQLGDGIDPSHVEFTRDANHLILGLEGGERLVIQNWYIDPANRIEELLFADGTVWDAARMSAEAVYEGTQANDALGLGWTTEPVHMRGLGGDDQLSSSEGNDWLEGGAGNDTLYAANGADILDGGAGRDWLDGGLGNDTYHFGVDYGQDTIWDYDWNADNTDTVVFGNDVSVDQLWFRRVGNNLEVSLIGRDDALTINNWYAGDANHIEIFRTADGKQLLDDQVDALVNAMASFAPPAAGQTTLPPSYQSALMPVLSANWH